MKSILSTGLVLAALCAGTVFAQDRMVGQVDLTPMQQAIGHTAEVNLNFGNVMIRGLAEGMRGSNDRLADLLDSVAGVRVMVYEDVDAESLRPLYTETLLDLANDGWTAALEVRGDDEQVDIYVKESVDIVDGIMVMVNGEDGSAVFVNVYGALDPVFIGQLIGKGLDFDDLDMDVLMEIGKDDDF